MVKKEFEKTRKFSSEMVKPLLQEEWRIQSMLDVSPPWWNLGHTSWFFARNILHDFGEYTEQDKIYDYLLNSYYNSLGKRISRDRRGLITRPTNQEVIEYRSGVDERMRKLLEFDDPKINDLTKVGIEHERQHQGELFFAEIKHIRFQNLPELRIPYRDFVEYDFVEDNGWTDVAEGIYPIGNLEGGWGWDNEYSVHQRSLNDFRIKNQLVTNKDFVEFIKSGGYEDPLLWLSNGFDAKTRNNWDHPLYWDKTPDGWSVWTLQGQKPLNLNEPVSHISFYEAEAFARWHGSRLLTEFEWEAAARINGQTTKEGNFVDSGIFHAIPAQKKGLSQMLGNLMEWTTSHYEPYPKYNPFQGALTEYNGKFMDNQRVLRGGSYMAPKEHYRISYRNFWHPETRFQPTGIRLAKDK